MHCLYPGNSLTFTFHKCVHLCVCKCTWWKCMHMYVDAIEPCSFRYHSPFSLWQDFLFFINSLHLFWISTTVSLPTSPPLPPPLPSLYPFLLFLFIKRQASHGCQHSTTYQAEVRLSFSFCIKAGKRNLVWRTGSQKPA